MNPIREAYIRGSYNSSSELGIAPFLAGDIAVFSECKLLPKMASDTKEVDAAWIRWVDHVTNASK